MFRHQSENHSSHHWRGVIAREIGYHNYVLSARSLKWKFRSMARVVADCGAPAQLLYRMLLRFVAFIGDFHPPAPQRVLL